MEVNATAKKLTEDLLALMGVEGTVEVSSLPSEDETEKSLSVTIDSPDSAGLLIGSHGATLAALQSFIAISLKQQTGEWYRIVADVGDWREKQDEYLKGLALQAADRAKTTGEPQHLYNLTANQRRIIHTTLSENDDVVTESQGEGDSRFLVVKLK